MPEPTQTRQWQTNYDGIPNLRLTTANVPPPTPTQVLVKIHAVSLNYKDGEIIEAPMRHHKTASFPSDLVIGSDAVGTVISAGSDVKSFAVGDRVLSLCFPTHQTGQIQAKDLDVSPGMTTHGVMTEHRCFEEWAVVKVPEYLSDEEASCFPIAGTTAWMSLQCFNPIGRPQGEGKILLVQGTGGVSVMGLVLGKALGMKVIVTSSSDAKLERAKLLGADYTINYKTTPEWHTEVLRLTDNHGADLIFENGGAYTTSKSMDCIAFGGTIASIGYVSGKTDPPGEHRTNINVRALAKNFVLVGLLNGPKDRLEELLAFVESKGARPVIDKVFGFEQANEAVKYVWEGQHFGKVVVKVSER